MSRGAPLKSSTPPLSILLPTRRAEERFRVFAHNIDIILESHLLTLRNLPFAAGPILRAVTTAPTYPLYISYIDSVAIAISPGIIGGLFTTDLCFARSVSPVVLLERERLTRLESLQIPTSRREKQVSRGNLPRGQSFLDLIARREAYIADNLWGLSFRDLELDWTFTDLRAGNSSRRVSTRSKYSQHSVLNAITVG